MSESGRISRRHLLQLGAASPLLLNLARSGDALAAQPAKPNVIFIMADDLGYADLSCYGRREYRTPNIDSLADEGLKLTQGYANSAVCSATRFGLITGRYQYRLPGGLNEPIAGDAAGIDGLPVDHPTLPSLFRKLGYRTSLVGKWHLGQAPKFGPLKSGYDRFFGIPDGGADYYTYESTESKVKGKSSLMENDQYIVRDGYLTDLLGRRAVDDIEEFAAGGSPFFMSLHFNAPHWPWEKPDASGREVSAKLGALRHYDGGDAATYAAMVQNLDLNVGKVLRALERAGVADNTIVVFTSDNGGERFSDNWPFKGMKDELLEGGMRIPVLVRWPARITAGQTSDQVMISMDWLPTLLAAAGGKPDPAYPSDGEDVLPILLGQRPTHPRKLFWRYHLKNQMAVRDGNWKYLSIGGHEFLFDVVKDPQERGNLKAHQPDVFARLKADFAVWNAGMLPYTDKSYSYELKGGDRLAEQ
ncbi:MAG: sulfatase-like hydrolase/transferase [Steroidobacteraceae bacterium]